MGTTDGKPVTVRVELDGKPPSDQHAGADLKTDAHGRFLEVSENRLYEIIKTGKSQAHELKLKTDSDKLCLYTYTFG